VVVSDVSPVDPGSLAARYPSPRRAPWDGFALAADAAVRHLNERLGLDLWLVTHVQDGDQTVIASAGHWAALASPGTAFSWRDSFCLRMIEQQGPTIAADVLTIPGYAPLATGVLARVRSYVGVPLEGDEGALFGTLCAFAGEPQPEALGEALSLVELVGQMLSTILAREQQAAARSQDAASAYALAERDQLTGLLNRRGLACRARAGGATAAALWLPRQRGWCSDVDDLRSSTTSPGPTAGDALLVRCAGRAQEHQSAR
jgi:GAF domain-containing protein